MAASYHQRLAALTSKHEKARAMALPFSAGLGLKLACAEEIDTDRLGTFTGEVERRGSPRETVAAKARLGMEALGLPLGLASEGSFGPHPVLLFVPGTEELMVFIDDELGIEVCERLVSTETNYASVSAASIDNLQGFLRQVKFPSHALIVRANRPQSVASAGESAALNQNGAGKILKGLRSIEQLEKAIQQCQAQSEDGLALVQTDMRAHMNPTRMRLIRKLAVKLTRRLQKLCELCQCPGWGLTGVEPGLPCGLCGFPSDAARFEIYSCPRCDHEAKLPRQDGLTHVDPGACQRCNP
ncbi:MAG: hypothetical protein HY986_19785 [Candidatus Melainabacteria bacterium]|nr:hypothetical protein [Candidatus Melainabacteria bacterium]